MKISECKFMMPVSSVHPGKPDYTIVKINKRTVSVTDGQETYDRVDPIYLTPRNPFEKRSQK